MHYLILVFLLVSAITAQAEAVTVGDKFREVKPQELVSAFLGNCAQNPGRLDKVGAGAIALGYAELPEPFLTMLSPQAADAPFEGWMATEGPNAPFLLGISEGVLDGRTYQFCAISNPFMDADIALGELKKFIPLDQPIVDETTAGQRYRSWLVPSILEGAFLSTSDISGMELSGVTISIAAPKQY